MIRSKRVARRSPLRLEPLESRRLLSAAPVLHYADTLALDGVDDRVELADRPEWDIDTFTIALWFKADDPHSGTQALLARGEDWQHDKAQWIVELNDARHPGRVQLWYEQANDADHYFAASTAIEPGQWYHFAATRSLDGQVQIYLDGQLELDAADTARPASVETPVLLGARRNAPDRVHDFFDGALHEVTVFDEVLPPQAIDELMRSSDPSCWVSDEIEVSAVGQNADVAMHADGRFVVAWQAPDAEADGIFAQRYDADGAPLGGPISVNVATDGMQHDPTVVIAPDGRFVVAWGSTGDTSDIVLLRRFEADGDPAGGETVIDADALRHHSNPDLAGDGQGNFVVAWNGRHVSAQRFNPSGQPIGATIAVSAEQPATYTQAHVAMNRTGAFVVSYAAGQWNDTNYATFDAAGQPLASGAIDSYLGTGLAMNDDGMFAVAWVSDYPEQPVGDKFALFAQVFTLQGQAIGTPTMVSPGKAGGLDWNIYETEVAMTDDSFTVVWKDYDFPDAGAGHGEGIYAARFDLDGRPLGEEIELGQFGVYDLLPTVAAGDDGRLVVAWQIQWGDGVRARLLRCGGGTPDAPEPLLHLADRQRFDGVDDYQQVDQTNLDVNQFTIAFWFQADYPDRGAQALIARGEDVHDKAQWIVRLNPPQDRGRVQLWYEDGGDADAYFATDTRIAAERWYHFAATRAADGRVDIYLDGALEQSAASALQPVSTAAPVLIGARTNAPHRIQDFFDGAMEHVAVYGETLSAAQINRLMLATVPAQSRTLVYAHPNPIQLNGIDEYLVIDDPELNTRQFTIALSFQADAPSDRTQSLIARGEDWATDMAQWVVELNDRRNPDRLQLWYEQLSDADHYFAAPTPIEADAWYHAVVTRAPEGLVRIYLDGQLVAEQFDPATPAMVDTPVLIGARMNRPDRVQDYFAGTIENVEVYNYAMSVDEVHDIVPGPRLELLAPVDGGAYGGAQVDVSLAFDRPLTDVWYSLDGGPETGLLQPNWVRQEDPDETVVRSWSSGSVEFHYDKPAWAVAARWEATYSTPAGSFTVVDDLPHIAFDTDPNRVVTRVVYPSTVNEALTQYRVGSWFDLRNLGPNNPGGSGDNAAALYDGNPSTGAAYHLGARRWLTSVSGTFVRFNEEAMWWDVRLVEDSLQSTIDVAPGAHTLTVFGTDTLGKTSSVTVSFSS